jgi:hypothetical protein
MQRTNLHRNMKSYSKRNLSDTKRRDHVLLLKKNEGITIRKWINPYRRPMVSNAPTIT